MKKNKIYYLALLLTLFSSPAWALNVYTDRASFEAANPGLTLEDFEAGLSAHIVCQNPLSSTTSGPCFAAGGLAAGVEYTLPDSAAGTLLALEADANDLTKFVGANSLNDFLAINFSGENITAAGLVLRCNSGQHTGNVRFFGAGGLITDQSVACTTTINYIAITSDEPIVRVETQTTGQWEFVDDLLFGRANAAFTDGFE